MNPDRSKYISEGPVIPRQTYSLVEQSTVRPKLHAGLMLDKFSKFPGENTEIQEKIMSSQRKALNEVCKSHDDGDLLNVLNARRAQMLTATNAAILSMCTQEYMTLHLSRPGTWENAGISLHPIYGFVYLPGSGLKGLARAWAETVWAPAQPDQKWAWHLIEDAFGYTTNSEKYKKRTGQSGWRPPEIPLRTDSAAGLLVFHDAWPSQWPHLEVDISNSHHSKYYRGEQYPDDTEDPNPVYFLAIGKGVEFQFAISDRKQHSTSLIAQGIRWLQDALTAEGAGAKTAAGYGRFIANPPVSVLESPSVTRKEYEIELISMAFLAGANQEKHDCDLRPSTLRGLLRWWWRTMHTGHIDLDTLRKLESSIWGDTDTGSPVRIQLQKLTSSEAILFKPQNFDLPSKNQHYGHGGKRQTLGLAYASYGMENNQRWCQPEGSKWRLTVRIRNGYYGEGRDKILLDSDTIQRQVEAATWLFTQYGGAGSKSRKGFGSFADVKIEGIESKTDCENIGKELRQVCSLSQSSKSVKAPSLENAIIMESQSTGIGSSVWAVHFIGELIQKFSRKIDREKRNRAVLGKPRAKSYNSPAISGRHASPALWSLSKNGNGILKIRLIGFPSDKLPQSEEILKELRDYAREELRIKARTTITKRKPHAKHSQGNPASIQRHQTPRTVETQQLGKIPVVGDTVSAILLDEKTKKGDWKAKHIDSGLIGHMHDPQNAPSDVSVGQKVDLIVASIPENSIAFRWAPLPRKKSRSKRK